MLKKTLPLLIVLSLAACSQSEAPPAAAPAEAPKAAEPAPAPAEPVKSPLEQAVAGAWRTPENVARDAFRNPAPTLGFFGVEPTEVVLEITPGGGWYTEILAPLLRDGGSYIAAVVDPAKAANERAAEYYGNALKSFQEKLAGNAEVYGKAQVVQFDPANPVFGAPGSVDTVLTFRNVHNWMPSGAAPAYFKGFYDVLREGGTLGIVEHRAAEGTEPDGRSGYVTEAQVIALAEAAGFKLEEKSEINANPKDTRDHANGVWSLPPVLRGGDEDREKFVAIGESDRMTLRFVKPAASDSAPPAGDGDPEGEGGSES
ncbi:class I SAM-dependent methyltransferase [Aquimonas voraii]|uniref:Predicted methyltransferase n=1 Tax=Aquimonas voraii TaxID=265719 RepID=A0A1G6X428_9GAMM|nr:class I SAM-dependent methyltransferase [Aquimonas voraii]SDD72851.1 Predicted methyltransferase [Aquimonas voraii]